MVALKEMAPQTDCRKCPFMATDGTDTLLSPMMCMALWATKHCVSEKILDDCPLVEIVTCKHNDEGTCYIDGLNDYFCSSGERNE